MPKKLTSATSSKGRCFGRSRFLVNDPAAIKHVLLDNAPNYQKSEITRRILEPGLGRGLITSEGETWRRHRRTMSPAFDHRSIASYTPIMTEAALELLAAWSRRGTGASVDVATAMMASHAQHHLPHNVFDPIPTALSRSWSVARDVIRRRCARI